MTLDRLTHQVERLNELALTSVTAPEAARQELVRTLPLCDVHPSLQWLWHVLLHACNLRAQELGDGSRLGPAADRPRELWTDCSGILLVDDGGGMPVENFDDGVAVEAFLAWLKRRRAERDRKVEVARRRQEFRLIEVRR